MKIRVCVSILPKSVKEATNLIEKAEVAQSDLIEVRLDCLEDYYALSDLSAHSDIDMIATNRSNSCDGYFSGSESERKELLLSAAKNGFKYVDLELSTPRLNSMIEELNQLGAESIVSFHDFTGPLNAFELRTILNQEISSGAHICKIVTTAKQIMDNLPILDFTLEASRMARIVCFSMGPLGKISRLLSPLFGGLFTFASLTPGLETAPGQMSIKEMRVSYDLLGAKDI